MDFLPFEDYLGLNALVTKFQVHSDPHPISSPSPWSTAMTSGSQLSPTTSSSSSSSPPPAPLPLQPFDIIQLSKVYADKNSRRRRKPLTHCVFCKNNSETERVYSSHTLKDEAFRVTCPILRAYTCPICGANGDHAHTIKYCPENTGQSHH